MWADAFLTENFLYELIVWLSIGFFLGFIIQFVEWELSEDTFVSVKRVLYWVFGGAMFLYLYADVFAPGEYPNPYFGLMSFLRTLSLVSAGGYALVCMGEKKFVTLKIMWCLLFSYWCNRKPNQWW